MSEEEKKPKQTEEPDQLAGGTYEIIRNRLLTHANDLRQRLDQLNSDRKQVFGSIETRLETTERVVTINNCVPRDMVLVGDVLLFGYNVKIGLKKDTDLGDVFSIYDYTDRKFHQNPLDLIEDERFRKDFHNLYRYYKKTFFTRFEKHPPYLHFVFQVGEEADALKTFKWHIEDDGSLTYVDNRSEFELHFPEQHEFEWIRTNRDMQRAGEFGHISIEDRIFVETTGGDLTIKVEDNTDTGAGIYAERVDDPDQTLDDATIFYSIVGNLVFLKILPYQEEDFRYIVYNEKVKEARRIDAIQDACVLLPEGHGIIFANGYYLQTGEYKLFDSGLDNMRFQKRIPSVNGEDTLFVFINPNSGTYILLSYNMITQQVDTPQICHGYTYFENGEMLMFRTEEQPQKYHTVQIWQTPFVGPNYEIPTQADSYLYKLGNRDIVRCMAACRGVLNLVNKDESYANIYVDIVRESSDILDTYFWLNREEASQIAIGLSGIRESGQAAIEEFDKVVRIRRDTQHQLSQVSREVHGILGHSRTSRFDTIEAYVKNLADLRSVRGSVISLKELRYVDLEEVSQLENEVVEQTELLSHRCVEFLLGDDALAPYKKRVGHLREAIEPQKTVTQAREVEKEVNDCANELEMLIEIVSNLKIEDATQRTTIIDNISLIYSSLNQVRSELKNKIQELAKLEGSAEFASQMKLLNQTVINYLDVCDSAKKVEEYLTKVMIQIGELEGKFADFDDYIVELTDKRTEIYNAFESRKLTLVESRNKRTHGLMRSAERILAGMKTRLASLDTVDQINGYFASDLMVDKIRDIIDQLKQLDDSVKADDVQSRLKTLQQDTLRQLKDRQELYVEGQDVIKFGPHRFSVNTQELALTTVIRDDKMYLHLTGTNFFEELEDDPLNQTRDVWDQTLCSENKKVYRAEYLATRFLESNATNHDQRSALAQLEQSQLHKLIQDFMGPRYAEGYVKGVHDHDATLLVQAILEMQAKIGLLRFHTRSRALAMVSWFCFDDAGYKKALAAKLSGFGNLQRMFQRDRSQKDYIAELEDRIDRFVDDTHLFETYLVKEAATYLFKILCTDGTIAISQTAAEIYKSFENHINRRQASEQLQQPLAQLSADPASAYSLIREWFDAFMQQHADSQVSDYRDEAAALLLCGNFDSTLVSQAQVTKTLAGMSGNHPTLVKGKYELHFNRFRIKMARFDNETAPCYLSFVQRKKQLVDHGTERLRLDEFKPRVLSSFVRNKLIDRVYLPLVGDNLAKQIGVVGENKRTDRMGLLLLISPPGYGKTTLMEYLANRLGIIFMKINGPAIGNQVTSLDPAEAPNAAAREELNKLNLSLEMGDNVMLYLDDIQHCNPEFLQKFISLCDAQRKIEGVYRDRTRTYDLRGKKVCVVMAGNPYSESGEAFRIPDMLANRADTYNLGDIIGDSRDWFELSYIENALTSNPSLTRLTSKHFSDTYQIANIAETGSQEGFELEGNYSAEELAEYVSVMGKLMRVRDVVLKVNQAYILSAAQSDDYRTEPPFLLQGSYRNMNRLAEKILPIMNDEELDTLILAHYESEAQTLTTGAEANLLKFRELTDQLTEAQAQRWHEIKKTFNRNQMFAATSDDSMAQAMVQLNVLGEGLGSIQTTLADGVTQLIQHKTGNTDHNTETIIADQTLDKVSQILRAAQDQHPAVFPERIEAVIDDRSLKSIVDILRHLAISNAESQPKTIIADETLKKIEKLIRKVLAPAVGATPTGSQPADQPRIVEARLAPETIQAIAHALGSIQPKLNTNKKRKAIETIHASNKDKSVNLQLVRRWSAQGTGASSIFKPIKVRLTFAGQTLEVEQPDKLLYQNSHHNLADSLEARSDRLRILWWATYSSRKAGLVHRVRVEKLAGGEVVLPETILTKVQENISS